MMHSIANIVFIVSAFIAVGTLVITIKNNFDDILTALAGPEDYDER